MNEVEHILSAILKICDPVAVIMYGKKYDVSSDKIKSADFCLIIDSLPKDELLKRIYVEVESDIPYNVLIYTADEWEEMTGDPLSYASRISEKGTVIYEREKGFD
jgi:hypothetical protein